MLNRPISILVTGADGQLGREINRLFTTQKLITLHLRNKNELDITDQQKSKSQIQSLRPDIIINCAAYTAVDLAESEISKAYQVNVSGAKNLALACRDHKIPLIHISSDYVYDSMTGRPIIETDPCQPKSIYAKTKYLGERAIINHHDRYVIIRTSWLYSSFGKNFVKTMIHLGQSKSEIYVVNDQIGSPTYTKDLAHVLLKLVLQSDSIESNIFNFSNAGHVSWYDFSKKIMDLIYSKTIVNPISTQDYNAPAQRPSWSVLSNEKINSHLNMTTRHWEKSLIECLKELGY